MEDRTVACPICMMTYSDPQLLGPCGHTFCRRCVEQLNPKQCPLCRESFRPQEVRPNYALVRMLQSQPAKPEPGAPRLTPPPSAPPQSPEGRASAAQAFFEVPVYPGASIQDASQRIAQGLISLGVPFGLSQLIGEEDRTIGLRIFLLDNSGSTSLYDGKYLAPAIGGTMQVVNCSRWEEIKRMAVEQARWQTTTGTPCEFVLLNPSSGMISGGLQDGVDIYSIDPSQGNVEAQLTGLNSMLSNVRPMGQTPLAERLRQLYHRLTTVHSNLARRGLRTVLIIATDGLPSKRGFSSDDAKAEVVQVLRQLSCDLPVFMVIRLCTNEEGVVEYYNRIDQEEELPLEVIDDPEGEAEEMRSNGNDWLVYSHTIHMIREGGTFTKLFDLLDERKLTALESRLLAGHMLQLEDLPRLPLSDMKKFDKMAEERVKMLAQVYNPLLHRMTPCINTGKLRRAVRGDRGGLEILIGSCFPLALIVEKLCH